MGSCSLFVIPLETAVYPRQWNLRISLESTVFICRAGSKKMGQFDVFSPRAMLERSETVMGPNERMPARAKAKCKNACGFGGEPNIICTEPNPTSFFLDLDCSLRNYLPGVGLKLHQDDVDCACSGSLLCPVRSNAHCCSGPCPAPGMLGTDGARYRE